MKYICILIIFFSLQSCSEDGLSHVVKIDLPEHKPVLSVIGHFSLEEDSISVFVSHSLGIIEGKDYDIIDQAEVKLYRDNNFLTSLNYNAEELAYWKKGADLVIEGNHTYRIEVSAPGYETIRAEQTMPSKVVITKLKFTELGTINDSGMKADELLVEFEDPVGEENYYEIELEVIPSITRILSSQSFSYELSSFDPLLEDGLYREILKDVTFDGKKYTIRFTSYSPNGETRLEKGDKIVVRLKSITRDKYLFHRARGINHTAGTDPFSEPILTHDNIEKGHGIFTLSNESLKVIQF